MGIRSSGAGAVWAAASTAFSALLYLFDIGTTISALRSYFYYQYICSGISLTSTTYLDDPVCHTIQDGFAEFHGSYMVFWLAFSIFAVAHLTYAFIFWLTLDPRQHPLRLAYFMPLIHLYRLFKVLWRTCSCRSLNELQESQKESSSLYNVLGASLETAPQFVAQFLIAMKLGQSLDSLADVHVFRTPSPIPYNASPDLAPGVYVYFVNPGTGAIRIPKNLILSLVASLMSGTYSASMAILFLIEEQDIPFARRACLGILAGLQTLVVMLVKATLTAALSQFSDKGSITLLIYIMVTLIMAWSFSTILIRSSDNDWQGKNKFINAAYSFALAYMSIFTGPIYMIVKFGKSSRWLIGATLLHVFGELIGVALVLFRPSPIKDRQSPCHSHPYPASNYAGFFKNIPVYDPVMVQEDNKYLTCNVFLGAIFPLLVTFILTIMFFVWLHMMKCDKLNAKDIPTTSANIVCDDHNLYHNKASSWSSTSATLRMVQSFKDFKKTTSRSPSTLESKSFHL